jgi:hypothetical protein
VNVSSLSLLKRIEGAGVETERCTYQAYLCPWATHINKGCMPMTGQLVSSYKIIIIMPVVQERERPRIKGSGG